MACRGRGAAEAPLVCVRMLQDVPMNGQKQVARGLHGWSLQVPKRRESGKPGDTSEAGSTLVVSGCLAVLLSVSEGEREGRKIRTKLKTTPSNMQFPRKQANSRSSQIIKSLQQPARWPHSILPCSIVDPRFSCSLASESGAFLAFSRAEPFAVAPPDPRFVVALWRDR